MTTAQKTSARFRVGQQCADGTTYLGYHADPADGLKKDWFTTAEDIKDTRGNSLAMKFNDASEHVAKLDVHGHQDWKIAHENILDEQYKAQNTGKFNGTYTGLKYVSSTSHPRNQDLVGAQYFDDGDECSAGKSEKLHVRPVRCELRP